MKNKIRKTAMKLITLLIAQWNETGDEKYAKAVSDITKIIARLQK